jgi:hypothetical protein
MSGSRLTLFHAATYPALLPLSTFCQLCQLSAVSKDEIVRPTFGDNGRTSMSAKGARPLGAHFVLRVPHFVNEVCLS